MEFEFFIALSAVLAVCCGYLWVKKVDAELLSDAYREKWQSSRECNETLLSANVKLNEKLLAVRMVLMGGGK